MQKQVAGILHSPLRVRNREVNRCGPTVCRHLHFGRHGDLAVDSVNVEHAVNLDGRFSRAGDGAFDLVGTKSNFRIALALQDFLMHLAVAHAAAALATFGVNHNLA